MNPATTVHLRPVTHSLDLSRVRILNVDDNHFSRSITRVALKALNVPLVEDAGSVAEGLALIESHQPDLILLDWEMPKEDGLSLVRRLRGGEIPASRFVPIILVSGYSEMWRVAAARDAGVNEFVVKPFTANTLYSKMRLIIDSHRPFVEVPQTFFGPDRRRRAQPITAERRIEPAEAITVPSPLGSSGRLGVSLQAGPSRAAPR
jgi:two-component system chemotaxis response regulator CheY